jgi:hypothetical protein
MPTGSSWRVWNMPNAIRSIKDKETVEKYISLCLDKVELAFGPCLCQPSFGYIPYSSNDQRISRKISAYFGSIKDWRSLNIEDIKNAFDDEYWSVFHYIGWEGTYYLTPLLIKLAYDGYLSSDEICSTVEVIFSKFPRESDDKTFTFLDWIAMYDEYQILCILDMMTLISNDPLKLFPDGFMEGRRWWVRYYLGSKAR